jgi:predicted transposase/invertase (TIGR01784 family)
MPGVSQRHDRFFREVFARPVLAAEFLRQYLPADVAGGLDLDTMALVSGSSVDRHLRQHVADVVYRVRLRSGGATEWVYVLLEHKSWPDPRVAYQLLRYVVAIWQAGSRTGEGLVPVVPVVVYHGRPRWRIGRNLRYLDHGPATLATYWPALEYHLVDLSVGRGAPIAGALWLQAVLEAMRHIGSLDLSARLPDLMVKVSTAEAEPGLEEMWEALVTYVSGTNATIRRPAVEAALDLGFDGRGEAMMATLVDEYIDIGRRQGLLNGIQVSLNLKFGAAGLALMPELSAVTDTATLEAVNDAILTARTVDDVRAVYRRAAA